MPKKYDFVAIGGGNAGLTATAKVRAQGLKVALIDRGPIGGLCSLNGCNPKKVLVRSTEVLEEARRAAEYGIRTTGVSVVWAKVMARKRTFTDPVTANSLQALKEKEIDFICGAARFVSADELAVNGETVSARGILVATGSTPRPLAFPGADLVRSSDDILALAALPKRLVIIGAGVVGLEFAHVLARAGTKVTVLEPTPSALGPFDQMLVNDLLGVSRSLGIKFDFEAQVRKLSRQKGSLRVVYEKDGSDLAIGADLVLNATGRPPAIGDLDLDRGSVKWGPKGVAVNEFLRSETNAGVFAAGDAHGRLQLSPVASYEGGIAARNFLEGDVEAADYSAIPAVVFTIPPLASVGRTEAQALAQGMRVRVADSDMSEWKVYAIAGEKPARARVVVEEGTERILGAHLLGAGAAEMIHVYAVAMQCEMRANELRRMVFAYPTFSSAIPSTL